MIGCLISWIPYFANPYPDVSQPLPKFKQKGSFEKDELAAANIFTEGANSLKDTESIYHLALMHQYGQLFAQNFTKAQIYLNQAIANQPESKMFFTMHLKFVSIHKFFVTNYSVIRKIVLISILILMILSVKNLFWFTNLVAINVDFDYFKFFIDEINIEKKVVFFIRALIFWMVILITLYYIKKL